MALCESDRVFQAGNDCGVSAGAAVKDKSE